MHHPKMTTLVSRANVSDGPSTLTIIVITVTIGLVLLFTTTLVGLRFYRRRRTAAQTFKDDCLRDPTLTWAKYGKRRKLTISRLIVEEELQRSHIIRKSQQSRTSQHKVPTTTAPISRPTRSRSKTWHGRTPQSDLDVEEGKELLKETYGEWSSAEANVEYTWQLLHGKKYPSPRRTLLDEYDGCTPERPPTVRLKTPPLLSHPMFRCSSGDRAPKHLSLPAELMRIRSDPGYGSESFGDTGGI